MASKTMTVQNVVKSNGQVTVNWTDGTSEIFASEGDFKSLLTSLREDAGNLGKRFVYARYARVDPDLNNPILIEGASVTLTDDNNNMVVITPAP